MDFILLNPNCTPSRLSQYDAGYDLRSSVDTIVYPGHPAVIPLGVRVEIPEGYFGLLTHRSSLAFNHSCVMSLGIIDSSFNNELKAYLFNHHEYEPFLVKVGQRIGQLVLIEINSYIRLNQVKEFATNGKEGFGSTGRM